MLRLVEPQVEVSDKECIGIVRKLQPVSGGQIVWYLLLIGQYIGQRVMLV